MFSRLSGLLPDRTNQPHAGQVVTVPINEVEALDSETECVDEGSDSSSDTDWLHDHDRLEAHASYQAALQDYDDPQARADANAQPVVPSWRFTQCGHPYTMLFRLLEEISSSEYIG